jgi:hypothetical protein
MELRFLKDQPALVQQELTQWDQFRTDELSAAEALIRESHQNSLDARSNVNVGPVKTRISIRHANPEHSKYFKHLLSPLLPHLIACNRQLGDHTCPRILVFEDFGTTGLLGKIDSRDKLNFSDFWRVLGRSHKRGAASGSWGLGKLAFPASSSARTFFGLTIREGDPQPYLMGQAVLQYHRIDSQDYVPQGFFANHRQDDFQLPVTDINTIKQFSEAVGFTRTSQPGLSIAIPFVHHELNEASLIPQIIRNYAFPILTGRLEVEIGGRIISAQSFDETIREFGGEEFKDGSLARFIRELHTASTQTPDAEMDLTWRKGMQSAVGDAALKSLREQFASGKLVHVRLPVSLKRITGETGRSHIDLFLRQAKEGEEPRALFVRGALTLPKEASQRFRSKTTFGALVASDALVAEFLRNAENPAHTEWNGGGKLRDLWSGASNRLSEIRNSLRQLHELLAQARENRDEDALKDLFSVKAPNTTPKQKQSSPIFRKQIPPTNIPRRPKAFVVAPCKGGFIIRPGNGLNADALPMTLAVKAAYDVIRGDPFKKFSEYDFDFRDTNGSNPFEYEVSGAVIRASSANGLEVEVSNAEFRVVVRGFDPNRDLKLEAKRKAK